MVWLKLLIDLKAEMLLEFFWRSEETNFINVNALNEVENIWKHLYTNSQGNNPAFFTLHVNSFITKTPEMPCHSKDRWTIRDFLVFLSLLDFSQLAILAGIKGCFDKIIFHLYTWFQKRDFHKHAKGNLKKYYSFVKTSDHFFSLPESNLSLSFHS